MRLFRSEEHVDAWAGARGIARGAVFSVVQQWDLARRWYADRMDPAWRRKSPEEARSVFARVGLHGAFWELT